ncbi:hypothetical protein PMAYCL1PPCAC_09636, partial [Pristionchus mayeri]
FDANSMVYRATFSHPEITIESVKPEFANAITSRYGAHSRELKGGTTYAYRMWDDYLDGVEVDATKEDLRGFFLIGTHRGKAYYAKHG